MLKKTLSLAVMVLVAACSALPSANPDISPGQKALNTTGASCKSIDAAIVAADQAVLAKVLKGDDARNAVKGLTAAQAGCMAALSSIQAANAAPPTPAASGVPK